MMPYSTTLNGSSDISYDSCDDLDENGDSNQDVDDCVWSENDKTSSGEWLNDIDKVSCDNEKKEFGPLYANLSSSKENSCPPIPKSGTDPNRVLLNHWSEYIHLTGRKFYYNSVTKQSSWKPPRRSLPIFKNEDFPNHSCDNLADSFSTDSWSIKSTSDDTCSLQSSVLSFINLSNRIKPKIGAREDGLDEIWTYNKEDDDKAGSELSPKWSKYVCNKQLYLGDESIKPSNVSGSFAFRKDFLRLKENVDEEGALKINSRSSTSRLLPIDRSLKAKSMAFLPTSDKLARLEANEDNEPDLLQNNLLAPSIPENLQEAKPFKTGILNRTKVRENGRRIKKNWCTSVVCISPSYLLIFRDSKLNIDNQSMKPEITIELSGSLIEWSPRLSSRKNVFQVSTCKGDQILLQKDCAYTCAEWFFAIKGAINKLPKSSFTLIKVESTEKRDTKDCKLKRSKSSIKQSLQKPESSVKSSQCIVDVSIQPEKKKNIKDRLKIFLRRRPTLQSLREKGIFKDGHVFGCDLQVLCSREKQTVPKFVQQCIKAIEQKDLKTDGIYRVCGNLSEVQKIRYQVNRDNYDGIWAQDDVHVLTGALKLFFRDMHEPLFPCNRFERLMSTISVKEKVKQKEMLIKLIKELPKCNQDTLKYLLKHLLRVQEHKGDNRMHVQNLAIVFGPTLMWPETNSKNLSHDTMLNMHSNRLIELLLLEYDSLFL